MLDQHIRDLIEKGVACRRNHQFYWKEKDGEYTIIASYGAIHDLIIWASRIWDCQAHKQITGLDEDGAVAYFKIGGKNADKNTFSRLGT